MLRALPSPVFPPRETASSWWAEPFLPLSSRDPWHAADSRARDSQESGHWWLAEARGWGGVGTRAVQNVMGSLGLCPLQGPQWGGDRGSPHLAAGTVLPAEQQQQDWDQEEEDEQGDEPPEGARGAF